jgi:hypothetical protein
METPGQADRGVQHPARGQPDPCARLCCFLWLSFTCVAPVLVQKFLRMDTAPRRNAPRAGAGPQEAQAAGAATPRYSVGRARATYDALMMRRARHLLATAHH